MKTAIKFLFQKLVKSKLLFRVFMVVSLFGQKIYAAKETNFPYTTTTTPSLEC